jgi:hypothetical protein
MGLHPSKETIMSDENTETQPQPNLSTEPGAKPVQDGTSTQPAPNISTEHQREGDARHPSDTLDRGQPDRHRSAWIKP